MVRPGDRFTLHCHLENGEGHELENVPVCIVLEVMSHYYFYPSWNLFAPPLDPDIDYQIMDLATGITTEEILAFTWPDTGVDLVHGLFFHGAMLTPALDAVIGRSDSIQWGYGPR